MEEKQIYFTPELEMVQFSVEDIITTSGSGAGSGGGIPLPPDEWS